MADNTVTLTIDGLEVKILKASSRSIDQVNVHCSQEDPDS